MTNILIMFRMLRFVPCQFGCAFSLSLDTLSPAHFTLLELKNGTSWIPPTFASSH